MKRVKLLVAYDGSAYCGWQLQPNGPTIEGELNCALSGLLGENIQVTGASRTDSGVHAMGNVAVFDTEHRMPADKICFALNQRLPEDIRVQHSERVESTWHPRKCNCRKTYEYKIVNRRTEMPVHRLYTHFCHYKLDVGAMREAAAYLIGEHDFKSFCTIRTQAEETVRTIYSLDVTEAEEQIRIRICGSGFLYNMVRIIAGTLMEVGSGKLAPDKLAEILRACDRKQAGPTAPAKGLTLVSLEYERELLALHTGENEDYHYQVLQSHIQETGIAFFMVKRCKEVALEGLLRRTLHHGMQNGAAIIYLIDLEKDRLKAGTCYGHYQIEEVEPELLEKTMHYLTQEERDEIAAQRSDALSTWYCVRTGLETT